MAGAPWTSNVAQYPECVVEVVVMVGFGVDFVLDSVIAVCAAEIAALLVAVTDLELAVLVVAADAYRWIGFAASLSAVVRCGVEHIRHEALCYVQFFRPFRYVAFRHGALPEESLCASHVRKELHRRCRHP